MKDQNGTPKVFSVLDGKKGKGVLRPGWTDFAAEKLGLKEEIVYVFFYSYWTSDFGYLFFSLNMLGQPRKYWCHKKNCPKEHENLWLVRFIECVTLNYNEKYLRV